MFFRNLTLFRFPEGFAPFWFEPREIHEGASFSVEPPYAAVGLDECRLNPVGPLELSSRGFVSPFGRGSDELFHTVGSAVWLSVGGEKKILPAAVVNAELQNRLEAIERTEGRKLGGRSRKRLKDDVLLELLPKAFVQPSRVDAYLDTSRSFIAVDTSSRKTGENVVSELRRALGSFPALPLNAEVAPRSVMTGWIAGEPLPEGLSLGEECELRDAMDGGAVVRCRNQEMQSAEIGKHLEAGKQVSQLALVLDDHVSFVLSEDLIVRKVKFLDGVVDQLDEAEHDDLRAELDARFALMAGEVSRLFVVLEKALRISPAA